MELFNSLVERINDNDAVGLQELMKTHNTKVEAEDEQGMTMLQHASFKGKKEMCQLLIDLVSIVVSYIFLFEIRELLLLTCLFFIGFPNRGRIQMGVITSTNIRPCTLPRYQGTPIYVSCCCNTEPNST